MEPYFIIQRLPAESGSFYKSQTIDSVGGHNTRPKHVQAVTVFCVLFLFAYGTLCFLSVQCGALCLSLPAVLPAFSLPAALSARGALAFFLHAALSCSLFVCGACCCLLFACGALYSLFACGALCFSLPARLRCLFFSLTAALFCSFCLWRSLPVALFVLALFCSLCLRRTLLSSTAALFVSLCLRRCFALSLPAALFNFSACGAL